MKRLRERHISIDDFLNAITAYYPAPNEWESDLKTRKES